jgi:hypothetical protein
MTIIFTKFLEAQRLKSIRHEEAALTLTPTVAGSTIQRWLNSSRCSQAFGQKATHNGTIDRLQGEACGFGGWR